MSRMRPSNLTRTGLAVAAGAMCAALAGCTSSTPTADRRPRCGGAGSDNVSSPDAFDHSAATTTLPAIDKLTGWGATLAAWNANHKRDADYEGLPAYGPMVATPEGPTPSTSPSRTMGVGSPSSLNRSSFPLRPRKWCPVLHSGQNFRQVVQDPGHADDARATVRAVAD